MPDVKIGSQGVLKTVSKYSPEKAISEYVWNGFDAGATTIHIEFEANEIGNVQEVTISDNGTGIDFTKLSNKFLPFMESEKLALGQKRTISDIHGKNGIGRLSFIGFALQADWDTVYYSEKEGQNFEYEIRVTKDTAHHYEPTSQPSLTQRSVGTRVRLSGIFNLNAFDLNDRVKSYLVKDFCWYLELHKGQRKIFVNNEELKYDDFLVAKDTTIRLTHKSTGTAFDVEFFQWRENLNEYSKYYYIGSSKQERHKENTSFNNKGDGFYHSVLIKSSYFDDFDFSIDEASRQQQLIDGPSKRDAEFRFLKHELNELLRKKRYPFLNANAERLISDLESGGALPEYDEGDEISTFAHTALVDTLRGLYKLEPRLFHNLNGEQKLTFTRFINLALQAGGRADLFKVVEGVVDLSDDERSEFASLIENISLARIIKTTRLLDDRRSTIDDLKKLVFDETLYANETPHIQEVVQANYWIFGEEYNLVVAEDKAFDSALRNYRFTNGEEPPEVKIDHPDARKQMDVFVTRRRVIGASDDDSLIENIIVELKSPDEKLGKEALDQVEKYMRLIKNTPMFNSKKASWTYILVGNEFKKTRSEPTPYIQDKIDSNREHGRDIAIYDKNNDYVVKVKTWSTIFDEFDIRHNFIYENLKREQQGVSEEKMTAEEVVDKINQRETALTPSSEKVGKKKTATKKQQAKRTARVELTAAAN